MKLDEPIDVWKYYQDQNSNANAEIIATPPEPLNEPQKPAQLQETAFSAESEPVSEDDFVNCSENTLPFLKHTEAMKKCDSIPVGMAFHLPAKQYKYDLLVDLANAHSVNKKAIVVLDLIEDGVYEVQRLPDSTSVKLFYKHSMSKFVNKVGYNNAKTVVINLLKSYLNGTVDDFAVYDKNITDIMKINSVITYTLIHRKISSTAPFRNSTNGPTNTLKAVLVELGEDGYIEEVSKDEARTKFNKSAKLYRIKQN